METKCFEVRDEGTCIPVLAIKMSAGNAVEDRFFWRCGYPRDGSAVILLNLNDQRATVDPYAQPNLRFGRAHDFIYDHFDLLTDGQVVDVRVILGETKTPAAAEIMVGMPPDALGSSIGRERP